MSASGPGLDPSLLEAKVASIDQALNALQKLGNISLDQYLSDIISRSAIERLNCRLVEVASDANTMVVTKALMTVPSDYHDSFLKAHEAGMLDVEPAMPRLRGYASRKS